MKNKKGFTLVELLAVIVILAVVSIIAIPIIINMIEEAKKGALKDSVEGLTKAADMYYFQHMKNTEEGVQIEIIDNEQTAPQSPKLNYKGDVKNGYVLISYDGKVAVCVDDGKYFASRALDTKDIVVDNGSCTSEFDSDLQAFVTEGSANYTGLKLSIKKFSSVNSIPSSLSDSTIAVVTDTNISSYYASAYAPTEPKEGMVWVITDNKADHTVKTNTSEIGVSYVVQYEDGNWNLKDSYIFKDKQKEQLVEYDKQETEWDFGYTGEYEEFTAPYSGYYQIELWGAAGGYYHSSYRGGKGAYTKGDIYLEKNEKIYIYVGAKGTGFTSTSRTSWNGGTAYSASGAYGSATGGGATDVRTVPTSAKTAWNEIDSLKTRIMVAAGGGGGYYYVSGSTVYYGLGGAGGGLIGYNGTTNYKVAGTGATQVSGGNLNGTFGVGGWSGGTNTQSGGGSGWYGGSSGSHVDGAGGGSSYISGHEGCISVDTSLYSNGSMISSTGKYFLNTIMIDGKGYSWTDRAGSYVGMKNPTNESVTIDGNDSDGHARIKFLRFDALNAEQYYNLGASLEKTWLYNYMGYYQKFTAPKSGTYKIELWGAQGGYYSGSYPGGLGAYTSGEIVLKKNQILYIYVGAKGTGFTSGTVTSWNGGTAYSSSGAYGSATGGGATDVRTVPTSSLTAWNEINSLKTRIMVAAGGGGGYYYVSGSTVYYGVGGAAGGLTGYTGTTNYNTAGTGATQISGGNFSGSFGVGGGSSSKTSSVTSSGGSGWYGGSAGYHVDGAGGGSSYISGHNGCIAVNEDTTIKNNSATSIEDSYSYTGFIFKNTKMIDGKGFEWSNKVSAAAVNMPTFDASTRMTGNSSNGFAKITFVK